MSLNRSEILAALGRISDPTSGNDIVSAGLVKALMIDGAAVRFVIEIDPSLAAQMEPVRADAAALVQAMQGVEAVSVVLTAHSISKPPRDLAAANRPKLQGPQPVPDVAKVIAIGAGKGGVGKSMVTANLAVALAATGLRVGVLDANIFTPTLARLFGVSGRPETVERLLIPPRNHGVTIMSMGLLGREDAVINWIGPMMASSLQQMLFQVRWGALDVLLLDLPPGQGDVQTTLAQKARIDGAIVVSTPQDIALIDSRKAVSIFDKQGIPVVGLVENMSTHICTNCGHAEHTFGHADLAAEAALMDVPLLAAIPLHVGFRHSSDAGTPLAAGAAGSDLGQIFADLALSVSERCLTR